MKFVRFLTKDVDCVLNLSQLMSMDKWYKDPENKTIIRCSGLEDDYLILDIPYKLIIDNFPVELQLWTPLAE